MATRIGLLAQELSRTNPWWRDPRWALTDPDLSEAEEAGIAYRSNVLSALTPGCVYVLRGPRRVGKTVAVKQKVEDLITGGVPPTAIVRVAADNMAAKEMRTVVANTALPAVPRGSERVWFFDEISSATGDWAKEIKWLRDNDPPFRVATVVLTGSNATALTSAAGQLAGRRGRAARLDRVLLPMGFRTFVAVVGTTTISAGPLDLSQLHGPHARRAYHEALPWLDDLVRLWEVYLSYGGFPRAVAAAAAGEPVPTSFVNDMFDVIARDVFAQSRLGPYREMALLERLWQSMASPANLSSIGQDVDVSHDVVSRHVGYLLASFLLWACPQKADGAWLARERAQDKLYAVDPLVARVPHLRNPERQDIDATILTEMQIGMAVRRKVYASAENADDDEFLFHLRTPSRKEIDFVSRHLGEVALEGKYSQSGRWRSEAATVNASTWKGLLATRNVLDTTGNEAWAVPAGIFAYLLDT
ncbi:MAG TPA: AAA family ATPase [Acidimicrobiales bacterium]|nr:AAA family ATPase [Acidimicrobiales bacterium]